LLEHQTKTRISDLWNQLVDLVLCVEVGLSFRLPIRGYCCLKPAHTNAEMAAASAALALPTGGSMLASARRTMTARPYVQPFPTSRCWGP
jgi:hypothetical protein